jgi:hypothetical protein
LLPSSHTPAAIALMRIAELPGLHNVGEGVVTAPGRVAICNGLVLETGDRGFAAGQRVMWRVSSHAVVISPDGAYSGVVEAVELRRGERYVRADIAGVRIDIPGEDARLREGTECRVKIFASGVLIWDLAV